MKDILDRTVRVGDLIVMNDYHQPVFTIISHLSASGNMMGKWYASQGSQVNYPGKFIPCTYIISPYKPVVLIPKGAIPDALIEDYERIVNDPLFNKKG